MAHRNDPTRRELLAAGLASATLGACTGASPQTEPPAPAEPVPPAPPDPLEPRSTGQKPRNVVLVITDDQRFDSFGFRGHPWLQTPHLDALAASGAWFANAFVTTSLCCPSRATMLTGLYAHAHGVLDNQAELPAQLPTYPQVLQRAGVRTAYIGKWHMGAASAAPRPGWDHWVGFRGQGRYDYPGPETLDPLDRGFDFNGEHRQVEGYVTDLLTDQAVQFLEGHDAEQPFCMVISHKACHAPFVPAPRHRGRYRGAEVPPPLPADAQASLPGWLRRMRNETTFGVDRPYGQWKTFEAWYRDFHRTILAVDEGIGRLVDTLRAQDLLDSTAILFVSDNGFMHGEKGVLDKRNAYETSMRIPILAWAPGLIEGGRELEALALNVDVPSTVLELLGLQPPDVFQGRSLLPLLRGDPVSDWRTDFVYEYFHERRFPSTPTMLALRSETLKLVTYHGSATRDELYDLQTDPDEEHSVWADPAYLKRRKALARRLRQRAAELGLLTDPVWGRQWLTDDPP